MITRKTFVGLVRDGQEFEAEAEYSYYGGCRGARDSCGGVMGAGPPLEPDDPPSVDIVRVIRLPDKTQIEDLTEIEEEKIREAAFDHEQSLYEAEMEDKYDDR